ncbi:FkbM family methyltransferase [Candidatus Beckwithbacteria bacterium]|nr:FkbM family methyltransferase [Candidatus Beckwithbacteria bacterium]
MIKKITINNFKHFLFPFEKQSYALEGEDLLLEYIFTGQNQGFYIDVGAHHPKRFSNTFLFYQKGWHGINIDATPKSMNLFKKIRPRDINLETAISDKKERLDFYIFNEPALNTFDHKKAEEYERKKDYFIEKIIKMKTQTLEKILDEYLKNQKIDFLTIDVEGFDFKVLKSLNLKKYQPKIILIESSDQDIEKALNSSIAEYLKKFNYSFYLKTFNTLFFKNNFL